MANEVKLKIRITDDGDLEVVAKKSKKAAEGLNQVASSTNKVASATNRASKARDNYNKLEKGTAGLGANSTKNFAKQVQTLGGSSGLVAAYATLAANIFAISAAFNALQRAAQVEQLVAGLTELGKASGLAMHSLSAGLIEATDNALSLEEAMRATAIITSAGLDPSSVERFGKVAKDASIALGRDMGDSLNRLSRGVAKIEPELLDELGIMVRLDEATSTYASSIGKSANDLTNFEKRQAFANAVLEEGERKFAAIGDGVDANPYDKLAASFANLNKQVISFVGGPISALAKFLASKPTALLGVLTAIGATILKKAIPAMGDLIEASKQNVAQEKEQAKADLQRIANLKGVSASVQHLQTLIQDGKPIEEAFARGMVGGNRSYNLRAQALKEVISSENLVQKVQSEGISGIRTYTKEVFRSIEYTNQARKAKDAMALASYRLASAEYAQANQTKTLALIQSGSLIEGLKGAKKYLTDQITIMKTAAANATILGAANIFLAGTLQLAGDTALFLASSISKIAPWIAGIMIAVSVLSSLWNFVKGLVTTDAYQAFEEQTDAINDLQKELATNLGSVDAAMKGQKSNISSVAGRYEALSNVLSQFNSAILKLNETGANQYSIVKETYEQQNNLLRSSTALTKAFAAEFNGARNVDDLQNRLNISRAEAVAITTRFLEKEQRAASSVQAFASSLTEGKDAANEFFNTLKITTPFTNINASISDVIKSIDAMKEAGEGKDLAIISFQSMNSQQAAMAGLKKEFEAVNALEKQRKELEDSRDKLGNSRRDIRSKKSLERQIANINEQQAAYNSAVEAGLRTFADFIKQQEAAVTQSTRLKEIAESQLAIAQENDPLTVSSLESQLQLKEQILQREIEIQKASVAAADFALKTAINSSASAEEQQALGLAYAAAYQKQLELEQRSLTVAETALQLAERKVNQIKMEQESARALLKYQEDDAKLAQEAVKNEETKLRLATQRANLQDPTRLTGTTITPLDELRIAKELKDKRIEAIRAEQSVKVSMARLDNEVAKVQMQVLRAQLEVENEKRKNAGQELLSTEGIDSVITSLNAGTQLQEIIKNINDAADNRVETLKQEVELVNEESLLIIQVYDFIGKIIDLNKERIGLENDITSEIQKQAEIQTELATIANTRASGALFNPIEEARIAEEIRQQTIDAAKQKYEFTLRSAEVESALIDARWAVIKAEMEKDGLTSAEEAVIDATEKSIQLQKDLLNERVETAGSELQLAKAKIDLERRANLADVGKSIGNTLTNLKVGIGAINDDEERSAEEKTSAIQQLYIAAGRNITTQMAETAATLGPGGELVKNITDAAFAVSDSWTIAFAVIKENGFKTSDGLQATFSAIAGTISQLGSIQQAASRQRIAGIDSEIESEKRRDGKSRESLARIQQLEQKKEQMARKAFEQNKKMQIAGAIASTAAGVTGALASKPWGPWNFALAGLVAAMGAAQIAIIQGTSYQGGGSSSSVAKPASVTVGERQSSVDFASSRSTAGEIAYMRGESGVGTANSFRPAFTGMKYRASGGAVTGFMVGEKGPEMFVPDRPGTIVPNDEIANSNSTVNANFTINAVDAEGVAEVLRRQQGNIIGLIRDAANSQGDTFLENVNTLSYKPSDSRYTRR